MVDIDLPFFSILKLLFKWLAAGLIVSLCLLPILFLLVLILTAFLGNLLGGFFLGVHHPEAAGDTVAAPNAAELFGQSVGRGAPQYPSVCVKASMAPSAFSASFSLFAVSWVRHVLLSAAEGLLGPVDRQLRRRAGKSDPVDAIEAARAALSGRAKGIAKHADGNVEAIRALLIAQRSSRQTRARCLNQIRHLDGAHRNSPGVLIEIPHL